MQALVHWTGVSGAFELLLVFGAVRLRHVDLDRQALDPSRRCSGHFLFDGCRSAGYVEVQRTGRYSHNAEHAGAECSCDQVRGRKALAATLIILGGVSGELGSRRTVNCFAVQVSLIFDLNGDHRFPLKVC